MDIITNNVPRNVEDYDPDSVGNIESYVTYKGIKYDLADFTTTAGLDLFSGGKQMDRWDGYINETYFSGILIRFVPGTNLDQVIMGRYTHEG